MATSTALGEAPLGEQPGAQLRQRIPCPRRLDFGVVAVELVAVGVAVGADAHALGVHHRRPLAAANVGERPLHAAPAIEEVRAVDVDDLQVPQARGSWRETRVLADC
jgi:hypothetical protein